MNARYTATRTSVRTGSIMVLFTVAFTAVMSATYELTRPSIEASVQEAKMRLIDEVLPPANYDNVLLDDYVVVGPTPELGLEDGGRIYRAWRNRAPAGLVLEAVAPDGYAGRIQLVIGLGADGSVTGVRVSGHRETPGLGDYVDPKKDRNKARPWIAQFTGVSFADLSLDRWRLKRDGGVFGYRTGATISARAVTNATARALDYATRNRDALYAATAGSRL